jgi:hypothetical protein
MVSDGRKLKDDIGKLIQRFQNQLGELKLHKIG